MKNPGPTPRLAIPGVKLIAVLALASLLANPSRLAAQTAPPTHQIGPGHTAGITGTGTEPPGAKAHRLLSAALTPETRQALQQAMDSAPDK